MDRIPDGQRRDLAIPPAEIEVRAVISICDRGKRPRQRL